VMDRGTVLNEECTSGTGITRCSRQSEERVEEDGERSVPASVLQFTFLELRPLPSQMTLMMMPSLCSSRPGGTACKP
jgi:hypothetical protein